MGLEFLRMCICSAMLLFIARERLGKKNVIAKGLSGSLCCSDLSACFTIVASVSSFWSSWPQPSVEGSRHSIFSFDSVLQARGRR